MQKIFKIIILLGIVGVIWYQFGKNIQARFFPCRSPIAYTLGDFDAKFGISKADFLSAVAAAEEIWEKPQGDYRGRDLFVYKEEPDRNDNILKINLIYDYRQDATNKLSSLGIVVENTRSSYDSLKAKFTALKNSYASARAAFDARAESFNKRSQAYQEKVEAANKRGGATEDEYNRLEEERRALNAESAGLTLAQKEVNDIADEINALVVVLNRLARTLNISVEQYNTIGEARGESFTEGVYTSDGTSREIDIYEFSSRSKLVRVLAHELGHALDLEHVNDPRAIMYELNEGSAETLSGTDLMALKAKCRME